ncbi:MAG: glycosyltransferase, partial [Myxococcales bacterium]|nr:glycosyltransferase [Myxococcales bacterium]
IHAHFAGAATECAMAASGLLGVPYSFTAHAHDIFVHPRALREKFEGAALTITVCEYNRRFLRDELGFDPPTIPIIVCCVDPKRFARKSPYRKGAPPLVVSIGRLVEKKGFDVLIDAARRLRDRGVDCALEIIGTGPLEASLKERIKRLGLDDRVRFTGALPHAEVYERLERAAVYAQPFCVAADGDRDSMPVVVKEAMAM